MFSLKKDWKDLKDLKNLKYLKRFEKTEKPKRPKRSLKKVGNGEKLGQNKKSKSLLKTLIFQNNNEIIARISSLVYKNFQGRNSSNIFIAILENH